LSKDDSGWKVEIKCGFYNYGLYDQYQGHPCVGHFTIYKKKHVIELLDYELIDLKYVKLNTCRIERYPTSCFVVHVEASPKLSYNVTNAIEHQQNLSG
jgi:hypothetical protein